MSTLRDLDAEYQLLMDMLDEDPDSEIVSDTLEALTGELDLKYEGYCKVIREYETRVTSIKSEVERLSQRKKVAENSIARLKNALYQSMQMSGRKKIEGDIFTISLRKKAPQLDKLPDKLPAKYLIKQEPVVDKRKLLADVKEGVKVKGVTIKQEQCLVIK